MGATAVYGAGRSGYKIRDRIQHSETVNPFKSTEAFWIWLGLGADLVTFGTLSIASTKFLSTFSQSTAFIDISRKFSAATRAMSIFSGSIRPMTDTGKALLTGYEIFTKLRHHSAKSTLKLPKEALMRLNDSMDEFSETNMLMMSITQGFWSKSKMSYCSPEEFADMVHETIIAHMMDLCTNKKLFEELLSTLQNDAELIEAYKHLDDGCIELDDLIRTIYDIFKANDDKMEIKLIGNTCEIKLNKFHLNIVSLSKLAQDRLYKIVHILRNLNDEQETKLLMIQDFMTNKQNFIMILNYDDALEMVEIFYDIFVICFDETFATIESNQKTICIKHTEVSLEFLKGMKREERLNVIFELKSLSEQQSIRLKQLTKDTESSCVNADEILKILAYDNDKKNEFLKSLTD
jgi:hypothetical protein